MGVKLILKVLVINFQELFTELKIKVPLSRYDAAKSANFAKSYTFWGFRIFSFADFEKSLIFGPRSLSGPHIGPSCCILWVLQTLFGIFSDFHFLTIYSRI